MFGLVITMDSFRKARRWHQKVLDNRDSAIEEATRQFKDEEQHWKQANNEPLMFSQREAETGEPDHSLGAIKGVRT